MAYFKEAGAANPVPRQVLLGLVILPPTDSVSEELRHEDLLFYSDFDTPQPGEKLQSTLSIRAVSFTDADGIEWMREYTGWSAVHFSGGKVGLPPSRKREEG